MIDYFEDGGELFDGRAVDHVNRQSYAYKLGRCIGTLEAIIRATEAAHGETAPYARSACDLAARYARECLIAIRHEPKS